MAQKEPAWQLVHLSGGPLNGESRRVVKPVPDGYLLLGLGEYRYVQRGDSSLFEFVEPTLL